MVHTEEEQVLERALAGDTGAMRKLVRMLHPVIQARAVKVLLRVARRSTTIDYRHQVEDLIQEVWLRLFADGGRELRKWTPERGMGLRGFVGLVAERDILNILRKRKPERSTENLVPDEGVGERPIEGPSPESDAMSREMLLRVVERLRAELSEKAALILELSMIEEQPVEAVCAVMGMTPVAVHAWRSRIAQRARAIAELLSEEARATGTTPGASAHERG